MEKLKGNRTTWIGILTLIGALINASVQLLNHQHVDMATLGTAFSTFLVAIHAADSKQ